MRAGHAPRVSSHQVGFADSYFRQEFAHTPYSRRAPHIAPEENYASARPKHCLWT